MTIEIKLSQEKTTLIDNTDYHLISQFKWYTVRCGNVWYASTKINEKTTYMHRLLLLPQNNEQIDHINRNGLDNRRCNLRLATKSENQANRNKTPNISSQFKGVSWNKKRNKWEASITVNYRKMFLGYFSDEIGAAKIYDMAAIKYFGNYALLNLK